MFLLYVVGNHRLPNDGMVKLISLSVAPQIRAALFYHYLTIGIGVSFMVCNHRLSKDGMVISTCKADLLASGPTDKSRTCFQTMEW